MEGTHCPLFFWIIPISSLNMDQTVHIVREFLEPRLEEAKCFIVDLRLFPGNRIRVFIECDETLTIEMCARYNRMLRDFLEQGGKDFSIEVSSPGIGYPLKLPRQYRKNQGRGIQVIMTDGSLHSGTLISAGEEAIVLEERTGKETTLVPIRYVDINKAVILVMFKKDRR